MKNLKVGTKILAGFLVVIMLIAVILVLTVITSLTRNEDLNNINIMTDLQIEANSMLDDVNAARIELRSVFTSLGAETEEKAAMESLKSALARMDTLDGYAADLQGSGLAFAATLPGELANMRTVLQEAISDVETVWALDVEARATIDEMLAYGLQMSEATTTMFDAASSVTLQYAQDGTEGLATYMNNTLFPAQVVGEEVDAVRILCRDLILNQDISGVDEMLSLLDHIESSCAQIRASATTDGGRAAIDNVTTALTPYRAAIVEVRDNLIETEVAVQEARGGFDELANSTNHEVDQMAVAITDLLDSTIATANMTMIIMIVVGVAAAVISVVVAMVISRMITKPIGIMKEYLVRVGTIGDMDFTDEEKNIVRKAAEAKDEVGQSLGAFASMLDHLIYISGALQSVADKDLTIEIDRLGDKDTMGNAMTKMVDNLNEMFSEINSVAQQVSTASGEVATGAQTLAQGSTEQASTVEEISASINEITEQANVSVETANGAAQESSTIRNIAQEGNEKMGRLSNAVQEMNEASQSIGQVIKVIDDIAFQTNILALNAAVEAARAGEHGKGFAVVADEVRNLAGKSADAAKETSTLISANIEKAEYGQTISEETAETLRQIVEGVEKTTQSLTTIAEQSEGSKAATQQVNLAVDQVAQVVQQNSATSEESAAASEEMSSQAQVLQQLIAQFKLKNSSDRSRLALPSKSPDEHQEAGENKNDIIF